jgi:hypothetical protein
MSDYQTKWQQFGRLRRQYFLAMCGGAVAVVIAAARDFSLAQPNTLFLNFVILSVQFYA